PTHLNHNSMSHIIIFLHLDDPIFEYTLVDLSEKNLFLLLVKPLGHLHFFLIIMIEDSLWLVIRGYTEYRKNTYTKTKILTSMESNYKLGGTGANHMGSCFDMTIKDGVQRGMPQWLAMSSANIIVTH
ncbi:hypothetical protein ACJX0J_025581, partial [Zea mays]